MFICEVNETEINFELKLRKSVRTLTGLIFVKADFYKIKKRKKKLQFRRTNLQSGNMNNFFFLELFKDTDMEEDMDKESEPFLKTSE